MARKIIAYLFAILLSLGFVIGSLLLRDVLSAGAWIACVVAVMVVGALLVNFVWQWANQDPAR